MSEQPPPECFECGVEYTPKWTLSPLMEGKCCWGCLFENDWAECKMPDKEKKETCNICKKPFAAGVCDLLPEICWYCAKQGNVVVHADEFFEILTHEANLPHNLRLRRYIKLCMLDESLRREGLGMELSDIWTKSLRWILENEDIPKAEFFQQCHFLQSDLIKAIWMVVKDNMEYCEMVVKKSMEPPRIKDMPSVFFCAARSEENFHFAII